VELCAIIVFFPQGINQFSVNETPVQYHLPHPPHLSGAPIPALPIPPLSADGRRRWTAGELTEIVTALATLSTKDIGRALGVNPKALRSALRRHGISLRAIRQYGRRAGVSERIGLLIRRSSAGPSATYGAAALAVLPDSACRWPLGDPSKPDFAFCSAPRFGHASYCKHHMAKAFEREGRHAR
jgi:GcrA cell cycle regulator